MKNKAYLFDLDDTLLHSVHIKWAQHQEAAKRFYELELDESTLRQHWGKPSRDLVRVFYQDAEEVDVMLEKFHSLDNQYLKTPIPNAMDVLNELIADGHIVGIVTNARKETVRSDVKRLDLPFDKLHFVHTYEDTGKYKPDPAAFDQALVVLRKSNIEDITYIGDSLIDLEAAQSARLNFIGVTTGLTTNEEFRAAGAIKIISNLSQLLNPMVETKVR